MHKEKGQNINESNQDRSDINGVKKAILAKKKKHSGEYIGAIVVNLIILYAANKLVNWQANYFNDNAVAVLWVLNLALIAAILGNLLLLLYDRHIFRIFVKLTMNIFSFVFIYILNILFPFDFSAHVGMEQVVRIIVLLAFIGTGISVIVEFIKLVWASIFVTRESI